MLEKMKKLTIEQVSSGLLKFFALQSLIAAVATLMIPTDPKNIFMLGYSLSRLLLVSWFLFACVVFSWMVWRGMRDKDWLGSRIRYVLSHSRVFTDLNVWFLMMLAMSIIMIVTPFTYPALWPAYFTRLRPLIYWMGLVSSQTLIFFILQGKNAIWASLVSNLRANKRLFLSSGIILVVFLLAWGWVAGTGVGLRGQWAFWNEAGVPILAGQILQVGGSAAVLASLYILLAHWSDGRHVSWFWEKAALYQDLLIGLGLWILAAVVWLQTPLAPNFFAPGPYPPDYAYLPYSDAATWDMYGQTALIGEGIAHRDVSADHAGLAGFYAISHLFLGQDFNRILVWQVIFYACFPTILYFLGKALHSRGTGIFLAGLVIVRSANAIAAGGMINLSHQKLLLTEFPTGFGLALLALWLVRWLRNPQGRRGYSLAVGALLAGLVLLRLNSLIFLLVVPLGALLVYARDWKGWVKGSAFVLLSAVIVLSPWMWRSWQVSGSPIFFSDKMQRIFVDEHRYFLPPEPTPSTPASDTSRVVPHDALITNDIENLQVNFLSLTETAPINDRISGFKDRTFIITNHFVHNVVTSVLVLPTTPHLYDLQATIYEVYPYWNKLDQPWIGALSIPETIGLGINLTLIALGLGIAWRKWGWAGWVPLGIFLTYNFATALAGTSGGRYIVPVDWIVLLYFAVGLVQLITWSLRFFNLTPVTEGTQPTANSFSYRQGVLMMVPFFLFVSAMTVMDQVIPPRYPDMTKIEVLERVNQGDLLSQTPHDFQELEKFLQDPRGVAIMGRALYPRFYAPGRGEHETVYAPRDYPRLVFTLIGNYRDEGVIINLAKSPTHFPHAADVFVVGCKGKSNEPWVPIDALIVVVLDEQEIVYTRKGDTSLTCPFKKPNVWE